MNNTEFQYWNICSIQELGCDAFFHFGLLSTPMKHTRNVTTYWLGFLGTVVGLNFCRLTGLHTLLLPTLPNFTPIYFSLTINGGSQLVSNLTGECRSSKKNENRDVGEFSVCTRLWWKRSAKVSVSLQLNNTIAVIKQLQTRIGKIFYKCFCRRSLNISTVIECRHKTISSGPN